MNRTQLKQAYEESLISKEEYGKRLVELEEKPKERKPQRIYDPLPYEFFVRLMKVAKKPIYKVAFILAYGAGLRISEIVGGERADGSIIPPLKKENIDLKTHLISIEQGKGKKDRRVNAPKWLKRKHLSYLPLKIKQRSLSMAFLKASEKAGFNSVKYTDHAGRPRRRFHFHSLRAGYAIRLLSKGIPVNVVQAFMGHKNLSTTSRYTKMNPEDEIQTLLDKGI